MDSEITGALVGAGIAGTFSFATFWLSARSEARRAAAEQQRFEATRTDQIRAMMVEERRTLLDTGAILLVEFDEVAFRASLNGGDADTKDWDQFAAKLKRLQARLRLWFNAGDSDHPVVEAFTRAQDAIYNFRGGLAGVLRTDQLVLDALRQVDPELISQEAKDIQSRSDERRSSAVLGVERARTHFYSVAHAYLAGDPL